MSYDSWKLATPPEYSESRSTPEASHEDCSCDPCVEKNRDTYLPLSCRTSGHRWIRGIAGDVPRRCRGCGVEETTTKANEHTAACRRIERAS